MNEAKNCASIDLTKQSVIICKARAELRYFLNERLAFFIVVMDMDFNIGNAESHNLRDPVKNVALILLLWIEEAVLGAMAGAVSWSVLGNSRPLFQPLSHTGICGLEGSAHAPWFVVVSDCDPHSLNFEIGR